jgi:hypothetical protein
VKGVGAIGKTPVSAFEDAGDMLCSEGNGTERRIMRALWSTRSEPEIGVPDAPRGRWIEVHAFERARRLATVWTWRCTPGTISTVATPIGWPYLRIGVPEPIVRSAILCPIGIAWRATAGLVPALAE